MPTKDSKKRKASELDDHTATNGNSKKAKGKKVDNKKSEAVREDHSLDPPFQVVCPFKKQAEFTPGDEPVCLGKDFIWEYAVRSFGSGPRWEDIKSYKHVKLAEMSVTIGDTVYVLHNQNAKPLKADATEEEILAYDKKHCWVGKVLQARATSDREVYILVAWLYWPNEIPKAVKSHPHYYAKEYANSELIMSNWLDIIDANSISAKADVYYLDEDEEDDFLYVPDRFWRQTFNAGEAGDKASDPKLMSSLKQFCRCQRPINPEKRVLQCGKSSCKTWNHEQCIIDEIGDDLWASYDTNKMEQYVQEHAPEAKSLGTQIADAVGVVSQDMRNQLKHLMEDGIAAVAQETTSKLKSKNAITKEADVAATGSTPKSAKKGRPKKTQGVWKATLDIVIIFDDKQPPVARVTEKVGQKRSWDLRVDCLVCGQTMD